MSTFSRDLIGRSGYANEGFADHYDGASYDYDRCTDDHGGPDDDSGAHDGACANDRDAIEHLSLRRR